MSLKPFNFGIVTKRVLPIKSLKYSSSQPMDLNRILDLAIWGARENLLEEISFTDDDIVSWSTDNADDYKDKNSRLYNRLAELKVKLDAASLPVHSITCDLANAQVFAHGAFTNNNSKIRELARKKAERALEIGRFFNVSLFIYQTDCDGFDSPFTVNWQEAWIRLANGLESISQYANSQKMTNYQGAVIAPNQSANYLYGFLNTPSDALAIINGLIKDRSFWGIAPSSAQLTNQGWEKAPAQIANIVGARRLAFLKVGGGTERTIRRAPHPILGTGNLSETAQLFWLLARMNWKGIVEYDNLATVSDAKSTHDDVTCKQFLTNNASALTAALMLAEQIKVNELTELTPSEADLMAAALLGKLDVDNIILRTIKNLPPAFETPQQRTAQQNGKQQQQNAKQQNGKPKQREDAMVQPAAKNNIPHENTAAQPVAKPQPPIEAPMPQTHAPQENAPTTQTQTLAPQVQQPAPQGQAPAIQEQTPAPQAPAPAPQAQAPAPQVQAPAPQGDAPVPPPKEEAPSPALQVQQPVPYILEPQQHGDAAAPSAAKPGDAMALHGDAMALHGDAAAPSAAKPAQPAPLPPPAPLLEEDTADQPSAENELPLILPDEKKPKPRGRKVVARGRKAMSSNKMRTPRKKPSGDNK